MRLLPDLVFGEDKISIQTPYTLNDRLIVDIHEPDYGIVILINDDGYCLALNSAELQRTYNEVKNRCYSLRFLDDEGEAYFFSIFTLYLRDIKAQCARLTGWATQIYNECYHNAKRRLERQNRGSAYAISQPFVDFVAENMSDTSWRELSASIQNLSRWEEMFYNDNNVRIICDLSQKKYIHEYNYKPEYIKHYMPNEDSSALLLGAEIEVAGNDHEPNKEDVVKKCIQIVNGSDDDTEDLIYSTSDSTVQIELDTMPCTLEFHKKNMNYRELFKYLDEIGYKGHDCNCAGLHIHADRSYLGKSELRQQLVITKILYILEKFNDEICVIARRNDYSKFVGKDEVNQTLDVLYKKYKDTGKKVALNLQHKDTIEFRCFKSTLKYETFILTLEFVKNIIDYAKVINIEEIELIQWSDLMSTFSDELKAYYNDRLKKKKKNKETWEAKQGIAESDSSTDISSVTHNVNDSWSGDLALRYFSSFTPSVSTNVYHSAGNLLEVLNSMDSAIDNAGYVVSPDDELGKNLKKEIKSLKKRIKNSTNYMEKKRLNDELSEKQVELKRLKRSLTR